ncbi:MAG: efflux RND transporter periplasmic adaptor subunit [Bacteroidota bacterium]
MPTNHPFYALLILIVGLTACGSPVEEGPQGLEELNTKLREKRAELRTLTAEIESIQDSIYALDPSQKPSGTPVTLLDLQAANFTTFSTLQATVSADETAMATSEVAGRITNLRVDEGDLVRSGQLIATVDVQAFTNQRTELETQLSLAQTVFERQERLWQQNIGSEIQYLEAKNRVDGLTDALSSLQTQIDKQSIYAPISGAVERVMLRTGELAAPGMPIISILSTNQLIIAADVPETMMSAVRRGSELQVRIPNIDLEFESRVNTLGSTVDPANRTLKVELDVPRQHISKLKPNMLAEVEMAADEYEEVITIPINLVQQEVNGRTFVFVAKENEEGETIAAKRYVTRGASYDGQVIIESGLTATDRLIDRGARGLVDEQVIEITNTPTPQDNG